MQRLETGRNPTAFYPCGATPPDVDGFVALDANQKAVKAAQAAGVRVIGLCAQRNETEVQAICGVFVMENASTNPATRADRGKTAWLVDEQTVTATAPAIKVATGIIIDVDDLGVWVDCSPAALAAAELAAKS